MISLKSFLFTVLVLHYSVKYRLSFSMYSTINIFKVCKGKVVWGKQAPVMPFLWIWIHNEPDYCLNWKSSPLRLSRCILYMHKPSLLVDFAKGINKSANCWQYSDLINPCWAMQQTSRLEIIIWRLICTSTFQKLVML